MKRMLTLSVFFALALLSPLVLAAPSSNVAWTSEARQLIASGNPERGKGLAASCAGCHGATGVSPSPSFPSLAGQLAAYTFKQLKDYQEDKRTENPMMASLAKPLADQDMADLAAFYAAQPLPKGKSAEADSGNATQDLVSRGDGKRLLAPCAACHGRTGKGSIVDVPALSGQQAGYFSSTMQAYRSGKRSNDIYRRMRLIAQQLTDQEIKALADYYALMGSQ
ncbi:MAG: c-type cytochrome [Pseudomonadota bacterium]